MTAPRTAYRFPTLHTLWEGCLIAVGLAFGIVAPFTCCYFYFFLALGISSVWLALLPRLAAGPAFGGWVFEALRVLGIAGWPTAVAVLAVNGQGPPFPAPTMVLVSGEVAWAGSLILVGLTLAAALRLWLMGRLETRPFASPFQRSVGDEPKPAAPAAPPPPAPARPLPSGPRRP